MLLPARSALQNWPSGTSLQQSLFRLILGWKPNNHATFLGTHIFWRHCIAYHVAIRADMVLVDPEDRATPLRAHTSVGQPACPGHFLIFRFGFNNTYLGRFPKASPTLSQEEPGSGVKNHLWKTMKWADMRFVKNFTRPDFVKVRALQLLLLTIKQKGRRQKLLSGFFCFV